MESKIVSNYLIAANEAAANWLEAKFRENAESWGVTRYLRHEKDSIYFECDEVPSELVSELARAMSEQIRKNLPLSWYTHIRGHKMKSFNLAGDKCYRGTNITRAWVAISRLPFPPRPKKPDGRLTFYSPLGPTCPQGRKLLDAANSGNVEMLGQMLDTPDFNPDWLKMDSGKTSVLVSAEQHASFECLRLLAQKYALIHEGFDRGRKELEAAAAGNDFAAVLEKLAEIKEREASLGTESFESLLAGLMSEAAENDWPQTAKACLEAGGDLTKENGLGQTPIYTAAKNGSARALRVFLLAMSDNKVLLAGLKSLAASIKGARPIGKEDFAHAMLPACKGPDKGNAMHAAAMGGHAECVQMLLAAIPGLALVENQHGHTPSCSAALHGQTQSVCRILETLDKKEFRRWRYSPVFACAVEGGNDECIAQVIARRPVLNIPLKEGGIHPLSMAAAKGKVELAADIVKKLRLGKTDARIQDAFEQAIKAGQRKTALLMLVAGANPHGRVCFGTQRPFCIAVAHGQKEMVEFLVSTCKVAPLESVESRSLPIWAMGQGAFGLAHYLCGFVPGIDERLTCRSKIATALATNDAALLKEGLDGNRGVSVARMSIAGELLTIHAARLNAFSCIETLRGAGAKIDSVACLSDKEPLAPDLGEYYTPLDLSIALGHRECARALIRAGSDPNAGKTYRVSPLVRAVERGERDLACMLIEAGADPTLPDGKGQTPLCLAAANGDEPLLKKMLERPRLQSSPPEKDAGQTQAPVAPSPANLRPKRPRPAKSIDSPLLETALLKSVEAVPAHGTDALKAILNVVSPQESIRRALAFACERYETSYAAIPVLIDAWLERTPPVPDAASADVPS